MPHTLLLVAIFVLVIVLSQRVVSANAKSPATESTSADPVNAFGCDLYNRLAGDHPNENLFFSPFSMASALAMTAEGARGQTADEMKEALHAPQADLSKLHASLSATAEQLGEKPAPKDVRDRIASLRSQLDAANKKLESERHYDASAVELQRKAQQLAADLNKELAKVDQYEFRAANALWGEKTFDIQQSFIDTVAKYYKTGGVFPVDFRNDPEGARVRINDWVSDQTRQRIKNLIAPNQIQPDTRLVLTNAVYFKGEWSDPFESDQTSDEDFTTLEGAKVRAPLMHKNGPKGAKYAAFNADGSLFATPDMIELRGRNAEEDAKHYPADDGFLMAELPYKGGDLSMVLILPQSPGAMKNLESKLTSENLSAWTKQLKARTVDVYLPKFKLETSYQMSDPLQSLGIKRAFVNPAEPKGAEFDGISPSSDPTKRLYISAVVHKAFVDVNEKGTEAAAATAVMMRAGSAAPVKVPFVPVFRADKPFMLLIRDHRTGMVLFMGRFVKPQS
jgi:serine protease inhibitor